MSNPAAVTNVLAGLTLIMGISCSVATVPSSFDNQVPLDADSRLWPTALWITTTTLLLLPGLVRQHNTVAETSCTESDKRRSSEGGVYLSKHRCGRRPYELTTTASVIAIESRKPKLGESRYVSALLFEEAGMC